MRPRIALTGSVRRPVADASVNKNKENQYFQPNNCKRRYSKQILCNHIITQSVHQPEDASLAVWALLFIDLVQRQIPSFWKSVKFKLKVSESFS